MKVTKLEKLCFAILTILNVVGFMLLVVSICSNRAANRTILTKISSVAKLTDMDPFVKGIYFNEEESLNKLNLNRTDLKSIKAIPCLSAPLAKRIYEYIQDKREIKELNELLELKGMTKKKLRELESYATAMGGHSGSAAWGDKINLNFATVDELKDLPGITKKIAEKIIDFRNQNGGFHSIDDLLEIPGLSEKTLNRFINQVEVK